MSLRVQAEADLALTIEDGAGGFGWPVVLIDPSDVEFSLTALVNNIAGITDPDTGTGLTGRAITVAFRRSSLPPGDQPIGVHDTTSKPWRVRHTEVGSQARLYRVRETHPDDSLGVLVCMLEPYTEA